MINDWGESEWEKEREREREKGKKGGAKKKTDKA